MSTRAQPTNLKDRIAALEQRNASQKLQPQRTGDRLTAVSPPTSAGGAGFLTPQTTGGALKDRIAKFEKKGGVPVPRGSFGLGAPPVAENAPARRRGELYGNRIPSQVKSHTTGPGHLGGLSAQITGPSPPTWNEARHSFIMPADGRISIPGLEYDGNDGESGGFAPPDSALGQPQDLPYVRETSPVAPAPPLADPSGRRVASDTGRRGIAFAAALDRARKAEEEAQGVYDPRHRESLTPQQTGSSIVAKRLSSFGMDIPAPSIIVSEEVTQVEEPEEIVEDKEGSETPSESVPEPAEIAPPVESTSPPPPEPESTEFVTPHVAEAKLSPVRSESTERDSKHSVKEIENNPELGVKSHEGAKHDLPSTPKLTESPTSAPKDPSTENHRISIATTSGDESDSGASVSTIQEPKVLNVNDQGDDDDLFVKPIKKKSLNTVDGSGPPTPSRPALNGLDTLSTSLNDSTKASPSPGHESFFVTLNPRRESAIESASPGSVSFAQKISPVMTKAVPVFFPPHTPSPPPPELPVKSESQLAETLMGRKKSLTQKDASIPSPTPADMAEYTAVRPGSSSSTSAPRRLVSASEPASHLRPYTEPDLEKAANRTSTFHAVVHGKVRETSTSPQPKSTPVKAKVKQSATVEPLSPGFNELSMLMQQSALLESRLVTGDYPDEETPEAIAKKREVEEAERQRLEKEKEKEADTNLKRNNTTTSAKSGKSVDSQGKKKKKLSLKRTFGVGRNVTTMETIPPSPPVPTPPSSASGGSRGSKDLSRSKSMDTLSAPRPSQLSASERPSYEPIPPVPTVPSLEPPAKAQKAHSIHSVTAISGATTSASTAPSDDDPPPTPPPKSSKYLATIRRFATTSGRTSSSGNGNARV